MRFFFVFMCCYSFIIQSQILWKVKHHVQFYFNDVKNVMTKIIILENDDKSSILTIFIWSEYYKNDDKNTLFATTNKQFRFEILTTEIRLQNSMSIYMMFVLNMKMKCSKIVAIFFCFHVLLFIYYIIANIMKSETSHSALFQWREKCNNRNNNSREWQ